MFILAFTGPYGEGGEILREMFFWPSVPHLPEWMVVPKAEFLTSGSSRNRERQHSFLRRREARIGGWPEIQKLRVWRCGTSGWRMWRHARSLSETPETESRPTLELNLQARPLGAIHPAPIATGWPSLSSVRRRRE